MRGKPVFQCPCMVIALSVCVLLSSMCMVHGIDTCYHTAISFGGWPMFVGPSEAVEGSSVTTEKAPEQVPISLARFKPRIEREILDKSTIDGSRITGLYFSSVDSQQMKASDYDSIRLCTWLKNLYIQGPHFSDDAVQSIERLPHLKRLALHDTELTDVGLERLSQMSSLEVLEVTRSRITDHGLDYLKRLRYLRSLNVAGNAISDKGLRSLADLPDLRELNIAGTEITSDNLLSLPQSLLWLDMAGVKLTDAGFLRVSTLSNLRVLILSNTQITDDSVGHLLRLRALNDLWLDGNNISLKSLRDLKELPNLRCLELRNTMVTEKDFEKLQEYIPNVAITGINEHCRMLDGLVRMSLTVGSQNPDATKNETQK